MIIHSNDSCGQGKRYLINTLYLQLLLLPVVLLSLLLSLSLLLLLFVLDSKLWKLCLFSKSYR